MNFRFSYLLCVTFVASAALGNQPEPKDLKPLGIPAASFSAPFGGYYMVRAPGLAGDNVTFKVVTGPWPDPEPNPLPNRLQQQWGVPPEAMDKKAAGNAVIAPPPGVPFKANWWYTQLKGITPGWIKLEIYKQGTLVEAVYYRFYKVYLIEDDVGDTHGYYKGFDPRYGGQTGAGFTGLGGPYDVGQQVNEPKAEHIYGYDDRFIGQGEWTGTLLGRLLRWMPEAMLQGDSLMFNMRNKQYIRLYVKGPREPDLDPVPLTRRAKNHGTGSLGSPVGNASYERTASLTPHDPTIPSLLPGLWTQGGATGNPPTQRHKLVEAGVSPQGGNGSWLLRWVEAGTAVSETVGDIEIEVKVNNPSNVWAKYGAAAGDEEGVMHGRNGTVFAYHRYYVQAWEPFELTAPAKHWFRRVCVKFQHQATCEKPDKATQGFGALVNRGKRPNDTARLEVRSDTGATIGNQDWADDYFKTEVWQPVVNSKMKQEFDGMSTLDDGEDPMFWCFWTQGELPSDVGEPWSTRPESIELTYRNYIGAIEVDTPNDIQFNSEPQEGNAEAKVTQHWINVRADLDLDGVIDDFDDDDELENADPGLVVNTYSDAGTVGAPAGRDSHLGLRRVVVQLSSVPAGIDEALGKYSLYITNPAHTAKTVEAAAGLVFYRNADGTNPLPTKSKYAGGVGAGSTAWVRALVDTDTTITLYVGGTGGAIQPQLIHFFLARNPDVADPDDPGVHFYQLIHLDSVWVSYEHFGIDVDVNNDGLITMDDDAIESEEIKVLVVDGEVESVRVRGLKSYSDMTNPVATLTSSVTGRVSVATAQGSVRLAGPPTATGAYTWIAATEAEIDGEVTTTYDLTGYTTGAGVVGDVDLVVQVSVGTTVMAYDWVRCRTAVLDLDWKNLSESAEENPGGFVELNCDNDNGSTPVADTQGYVPTTRDFDTTNIANEDDLERIGLRKSDSLTGSFALKLTNHGRDRVRIWEEKTKVTEIALPATWATKDDVPDEVWVEGTVHGLQDLREIELVFEYTENGTVVASDRARASVTPVIKSIDLTATDPVAIGDKVEGRLQFSITADRRKTNGDAPGTLGWVQVLTALTNNQITFTAASGRPPVTFHFGPEPHESWTDTNENGSYDPGEPFVDANQNQVWDFDDVNGTGAYEGGAHDAEWTTPLLDTGGDPVFYKHSGLINAAGSEETLSTDDNPSFPFDGITGFADMDQGGYTVNFKLYAVWRMPDGTAFHTLARVIWSSDLLGKRVAGSMTVKPGSVTTVGQPVYTDEIPPKLVPPLANNAASQGGAFR